MSAQQPYVTVDCINASKAAKDTEILAVVKALQKQVTEHFAPIWGLSATLNFVPKGSKPSTKGHHWWLVFLDNSDEAGALGYHDLTNTGRPIGKVFVQTDLDNNLKPSVTASHELLEMLVDPDINLTAFLDDGRIFAYEVADAVEADELGYPIDGIQMSDFVRPEWFEAFWKPGQRYMDYKKHVKAPLTLAQGGYISMFDLKDISKGWQQITADKKASTYASRPKVGSRRERRRLPKNQWMRSI